MTALTTNPQHIGAPSRIVYTRFEVGGGVRPLLAWRERIGHVMDAPATRSQAEQPFKAMIETYSVGGLKFSDCRTHPLLMERTVARISVDSVRDFAFHMLVDGDAGELELAPGKDRPVGPDSITALDLNQPVRMRRGASRVLSVFVPRSMVLEAVPDAEALHGRVLGNDAPVARLLREQLLGMARGMARAGPVEAEKAIRTSAGLIAAAFGKQAGLSGNARAALRAAMFGVVRRRINVMLHQPDLTIEHLLGDLKISRSVLYRLFEHEGGLVAYIRGRRLRAAADELVQFPELPVKDIAYGLGFQSASDFTRAFRRTYGMSPQDLRAQALQRAASSALSGGSLVAVAGLPMEAEPGRGGAGQRPGRRREEDRQRTESAPDAAQHHGAEGAPQSV